MRIYNTLTKKTEEFVLLREGEVKIYTCGPTVYDFAHIGNFRAYVFQDVLKRYLKYLGFKVTHVMNITDVDDKTIRNSRNEGVTLKELTGRYEEAFFEDLETLNIEKPDACPRATEHIEDMVKVIKRLMEKGYAYRGNDDSVYFDLSKFEDYGALAKIKPKKQKSARIKSDEYEKEEARDFALWKAHTTEDGDVFWDTEIGRGRPGWHIECSTMSTKYLGETFDIHAGGVDLIFPHHENEIAQAEAASGEKFVNYWLHNEHLLVEGQKMSKSLGNYYTLRDLLDQGHDPRAIRYLLLSTHYRRKLNFTKKALKAAENTVNKLIDFVDRLSNAGANAEFSEGFSNSAKNTKKEFEKAMDDDIDIRHALAAIFSLVRETNRAIEKNEASQKNLEEVHELMLDFDSVLGILNHKKEELPAELKELIEKREKARASKDFKTADSIRRKLFEKGIVLEDVDDGARWKWRK
jgi:cysteinyl-tRNA synthetase